MNMVILSMRWFLLRKRILGGIVRRFLWTTLLTASLLGCVSHPTRSPSPELLAAFRQYDSLEAEGKYVEAEPFALKTLELSKIEYGADHNRHADFVNNLGLLYQRQGRYLEAERLHKRALTIRKKNGGSDNIEVAESLHNLASVLQTQGRHGEV